MVNIYNRLKGGAHALITRYGQEATLKLITPPDPVLGGGGTETTYPATLVPMRYQASEIDGTLILAGDVLIYISGVGLLIVPEPGDLVFVEAKCFRIVESDPNRFDGETSVVHVVQGRESS